MKLTKKKLREIIKEESSKANQAKVMKVLRNINNDLFKLLVKFEDQNVDLDSIISGWISELSKKLKKYGINIR